MGWWSRAHSAKAQHARARTQLVHVPAGLCAHSEGHDSDVRVGDPLPAPHHRAAINVHGFRAEVRIRRGSRVLVLSTRERQEVRVAVIPLLRCVLAHQPVDRFADQVGMTGVTGVLLDQVDDHPAQVGRLGPVGDRDRGRGQRRRLPRRPRHPSVRRHRAPASVAPRGSRRRRRSSPTRPSPPSAPTRPGSRSRATGG